MALQLTKEQHDVLAHAVLDPQAWFDHAVSQFGEEKAYNMLRAKIARWELTFAKERKRLGKKYKTRAQREA